MSGFNDVPPGFDDPSTGLYRGLGIATAPKPGASASTLFFCSGVQDLHQSCGAVENTGLEGGGYHYWLMKQFG